MRRVESAWHSACTIWVGADDSPPGTLDTDYDDMILVLTSEDPSLNPDVTWANPLKFTIPPRIIRLD